MFVTYWLWAQISSIFWSRKLFSSTKKPKKLNRNQKKLKKFETRRWTPIIKVQNSPNNFQNFPKRCNFQTNRIFFHKYSTFTMVFKVSMKNFWLPGKLSELFGDFWTKFLCITYSLHKNYKFWLIALKFANFGGSYSFLLKSDRNLSVQSQSEAVRAPKIRIFQISIKILLKISSKRIKNQYFVRKMKNTKKFVNLTKFNINFIKSE